VAYTFGDFFANIRSSGLNLPLEMMQEFEVYEKNYSMSMDELKIFAGGIAKLYAHVVEQNGLLTIEHDNVIHVIEESLQYPIVTSVVATAFNNAFKEKMDNDDELTKDEYLRLMLMRYFYHNGDTIKLTKALPYYLDSNKPYSQRYSDILFYAMSRVFDFSAFLENMRITSTENFIKNIIRTNRNIALTLKHYMEITKWHDGSHSLKNVRFMAAFARIAFAAHDAPAQSNSDISVLISEELRIELFEMYVRVHNKYLRMTLKDNVYCAEMASSLHELDGFVYYAAKALDCKDKKDMDGYAQNLRLGIQIDPHMTSVVSAITRRIVAEARGEKFSELSAHEKLQKEVAIIKDHISRAIRMGNLAIAKEALEAYAVANPTDADIEGLRQSIADHEEQQK